MLVVGEVVAERSGGEDVAGCWQGCCRACWAPMRSWSRLPSADLGTKARTLPEKVTLVDLKLQISIVFIRKSLSRTARERVRNKSGVYVKGLGLKGRQLGENGGQRWASEDEKEERDQL